MKIATLQYAYSRLKSWNEFVQKTEKIVKTLSKKGVNLVLFPEYAHAELSYLCDVKVVDGFHLMLPRYLELFQNLSRRFKIYICSGTYIVKEGKNYRNRAFFFGPSGYCGFQDKIQLTPYENEQKYFSPGDSIQLFSTSYGLIGIAICYDAEFPPIVKQMTEAGAHLILVPSYTSSLSGHTRVHITCRARAIENQCYVAHASVVGKTDTDVCHGLAGIYTPSDKGFPKDGVLVKGKLDKKGAVIGTIDFSKLSAVHTKGETRNFFDAKNLKKPLVLSRFNLE